MWLSGSQGRKLRSDPLVSNNPSNCISGKVKLFNSFFFFFLRSIIVVVNPARNKNICGY